MLKRIFTATFLSITLLSLSAVGDENQSLVFDQMSDVDKCFDEFTEIGTYRTALKACFDKQQIGISDTALENISGTVSDLFEQLDFDNEYASVGLPTKIKLGVNTLNNAVDFISKDPTQIFNLHYNTVSYFNAGLLNSQGATSLLSSGYGALNITVLANASSTNSATDTSTADKTGVNQSMASASSVITGAEALMPFIGLYMFQDIGPRIVSQNSPPTMQILDTATINEAAGATAISVSLSHDATEDITVDFATSDGTATAGADYTATSGTLTFEAGTTSQTIEVTILPDSVYEGNETVNVTLSNVSAGASIQDAVGILTITEDETAPTVTLSASATTIAENSGSSITLTATLSNVADEDVTVGISTSGTATEGTDYGTISDITITAGNTTGTATLTPTDDSLYDGGNETAIVEISSLSGADATESGTQSQTITITDNETAPTVSLSISAASIAENSSANVTVTVTLSGAADEPVEVTLLTSGTTAASDFDMQKILTIGSGSTTATSTLDPTDDTVFEADETVIIDISTVSGGGATENGTQQQTVTITNDDSAPTVTLASSASSIAENAGSSLTLTATLSNPTNAAVTVTLSTSGNATAGADYASLSNITIAAGATTGTTSFTPTDDNTFEGDERAIIDISGVSGGSASESGTQQVTITISEDDPGPALSINDVTTSDESAANATFTITSSQISASNITVDYATSNGTATAGSDYTSTSGTATITAGQTTTTFNVPVLADSTDENNETATITLSNPTLATITDATGILTITDDDSAPSLSIGDVAVSESAGTATMTVTVSAASGKDITVEYASSNGTATAGSDYTAASGSLTIAAGATTKTFTVSITDDSTDENNESVTLTISNAANASISDATATLTINDDDAAPSLSIADATTTDESAASTNLTVSLSAASAKSITVDYATSNGTATAGADYTATSGTLTFAAGETSKTIAVAVLADSTFEGDESVTVTISNASNASISDATATLTITEDDAGPSLSINSVTTSDETAQNHTFTVSMSPTSASVVTVDYATSDGTASSADYTSASGTLTFNAGVSSQTFAVAVKADALDEANETVTVALSNASNATIAAGSSSTTLTITDDDAMPSLSINDATVVESAGSAGLTVTLSAASGRDVSFNYATSNGTAASGSDYTSASGTYTISAGNTTQAISVNITNDTSQESATAETFNLVISNATNASISDALSVISITDNDGLHEDVDSSLTYNSSTASSRASEVEFSNVNKDVWGGAFIQSAQNPFEVINVHKAYGYGLTGSGKQVAVVDTGFDTDHVELNDSGKIAATYGTLSTSSSTSYHGTSVAGIIAADDDGDSGVLGVAPNATLHLSSYNQKGGETYYATHWANLTNNASSAVAQNNSWGIDYQIDTMQNLISSNGITAASGVATIWSAAGYTSDATSAAAYISALDDFQDHGVVVYALSNDSSFTDADFQAALPVLFTELSEAWISAVNIDIQGAAGNESYTKKSAPCGQSAAFCLGADGHAINTLKHNDSYEYHVYQNSGGSYVYNTGTSYVAPMISGAVALLAQAFPNQTPEQWTDRLLASANNNIGFSQVGSVTFGNGVVHGYSAEAGHGIMDIYAALQPIFTSSAARGIYAGSSNLAGRRYDLIRSGLGTSRSFGDGIENGLQNSSNYFYDGLNGAFKYDMSGHVSKVAQNAKVIDLTKELASLKPVNDNFRIDSVTSFDGSAVDKTPDHDGHRFITTVGAASPAVQSFFNFGSNSLAAYSDYDTPYLSSKEGGVGFAYIHNNGKVKYLIAFNRPVEHGSNDETLGQQTSTVFAVDNSITPTFNLGMIAGEAAEDDGFLGLKGTEAFTLEGADSRTDFVGAKFGFLPTKTTKLSGMMTFGKSVMERPDFGILSGANDVRSSSFGLVLEKFGLFGSDNLALSISQPNRVDQGHMDIKLTNLSDSDGNLTYRNENVSIVPSGRQLDLGIAYAKSISENLSFSTKVIGTKEIDHVKSAKDVLTGFVGAEYGDLKFGTSTSTHRKGFDARMEYSLKF